MNKEQIEQVAREYAEEYSWYPGETSYESDIREMEEKFADAFKAGVQWRINSVWHSTDELPEHSGFLAVLMDNGLMETMYYSVGIGFLEMQLKGYTSWAYVHDLLPERKERYV